MAGQEAAISAVNPYNEKMAKKKREHRRKKRRRSVRSTQKPSSIALCMIVKDEGDFLRACLESVAPLVDEIVVVDTGSTDHSMEVARRFGAQVIQHPWAEDFSEARNVGLAAASKDWVLQLDCDEVIAPRDLEAIRRCAGSTEYSGFLLTTRNYSDRPDRAGWTPCQGACREERGYPGWFPTTKVRLFRKDPRIRYKGAVHELVEQSILKMGGKMGACEVPIHHYGYVEKERPKERYLAMGEKKVLKEPDNPKAFYELAVAYSDGNRSDEARRAIEQAIELAQRNSDALLKGDHLQMDLVFNVYGTILDQCGQYDEALAAYMEALRLNPRSYQSLNNMGSLYERKGDLSKAVESYREALRISPDAPLVRENLGRAERKLMSRGSPEVRTEARTEVRTLEREGSVRSRPSLYRKLPEDGIGLEKGADTGDPGRLSLCMIVRNEEQRLGRCLESVQGLVDEIIVVDTGSEDHTVQVAEGFGAEVHHFKWVDNFAAARNESLRYATGDWVLWLDADDVLPAEEHGKIRRAMRMGKDRGFFFILEDNGYEQVSCLQLRLFPNLPGVRFDMPVHEQVTPSLAELGVQCVPTHIKVVHTGYVSPEVVRRKKDRYLEIMKRWLVEHPEDYIVRSHIALTYHTTGRLDEAIREYHEIVRNSRCKDDENWVIYTTSLLFLGRSFLRKEAYEEALRYLKQAEEADPDYILTKLSLGECYTKMENPETALGYVHSLLESGYQATFFPIDRRGLECAAHLLLGQNYEMLNRFQEALAEYEEALRVDPKRADILGSLSNLYRRLNRHEDAKAALARALEVDGENYQHLFNMGVLHLDLRDLEGAEGWFKKVLEREEAYAPACLNLGYIYKVRGDSSRAETMYLRAAELLPDSTDPYANLGHLYLDLERDDEALGAFGGVRSRQKGLVDILLGMALIHARNGRFSELEDLLAEIGQSLTAPQVASFDLSNRTGLTEAFLYLGEVLTERSVLKCAEFSFSIVLNLTPESVDARIHLAEIFLRQKEYWKAISLYEQLICSNPKEALLFVKLGDCYRSLGVPEAAEISYQKAIQLSRSEPTPSALPQN